MKPETPSPTCPTCHRPWPTGITLSITDMPELLSMARRDLAQVLRDYADEHSHPGFAAELRELAAIFEVGQFTE